MKYISRITALLLVLMMLTPTFASALTLDTATQSDLDALYQDARTNVQFCFEPGLLGDVTELSAFEDLETPDAYAFQWYDAADYPIEPDSEDAPTKLCVVNTLEEQIFYCIAADEAGQRLMSPTFVIPAADVSNAEIYLNWLYDDNDSFYDAVGGFDALSAYWYMTEAWNVPLTGGSSLAEQILELWWSEQEETSFFKPYLLCSCVISGKVESSALMLHPNSEFHAENCGWEMHEICTDVDVSTPENLLGLDNVTLIAEAWSNVYAYGWQHLVYDPDDVTNRWEIIAYTDTTSNVIPITKESIQKAYRVLIITTENEVYESKPFFLGGIDFYDWLTITDGILEWMADDTVNLADVVARYNEYLAAKDEEDRTNATDYTFTDGDASVNLQVSEGAFTEDYVMEIESVTPSTETVNAVLQSMDTTGTAEAQVLKAFDISFASLENPGTTLQPSAPVALTFEVDTTGVDEDLKYLYVYHIANDSTPEVVAGPVEVTNGTQTIPVNAQAFSTYAVVLSNDYCAYCAHHEYCVYETVYYMSPDEQYYELYDLSAEELELFLLDYNAHVAVGEAEILCICSAGVTTIPGEQHNVDCPWAVYFSVQNNVLGGTVEMSVALEGVYKWYKGDMAEDSLIENATSAALKVDCELQPQMYYCVVTQEGQTNGTVFTFRVVAQTTVWGDYLNFLNTEYWYTLWDGYHFETYADYAYEYLTDIWNVIVTPADGSAAFNLAEAVMSYWYQTEVDGDDIPEYLCACVVSGQVESDTCILSFAENHATNCPWYRGSPVIKLVEELNDDGEVVSYSLCVKAFDAQGYLEEELAVVAVSEMLDEKYHYFQAVDNDLDNDLYVAYLYTDEETGEQWIIPLPSEKDLEENPAN